MCLLVTGGARALLLDAGSGLGRLVEPDVARLAGRIHALDIVLSHYHLDHVIGLSYLAAVWRRGPVRIFAPAFPLVDAEPEEALERLCSPPLLSSPLSRFPGPVEVIPVREEEFEAAGFPMRAWRQDHPGGSIGLRVGTDIAYLTDTSVDEAVVAEVAGVRLLIHELWLTDEEAAGSPAKGHSHVGAVAHLARLAKPRLILPVHHHPRRSNEEIRRMAAELAVRAGIPAVCAEEGRPLETGEET
jgi:ribonuclease BN (tRNA processing enzyme)